MVQRLNGHACSSKSCRRHGLCSGLHAPRGTENVFCSGDEASTNRVDHISAFRTILLDFAPSQHRIRQQAQHYTEHREQPSELIRCFANAQSTETATESLSGDIFLERHLSRETKIVARDTSARMRCSSSSPIHTPQLSAQLTSASGRNRARWSTAAGGASLSQTDNLLNSRAVLARGRMFAQTQHHGLQRSFEKANDSVVRRTGHEL